ncbi:hypothetical protein A616_16830 [Brevibacillus brevis X23]|nr:hypothetical protein A616_16830 [Brevibacillus brevis X23]
MRLKGLMLQCHTDVIMEPSCTSGTPYKVIEDDDEELVIKNNQGTLHYFSKDSNDDTYFGKWFKIEN